MEQHRKCRNGPTTIWSTNLQQIRKENPIGIKRPSLQQMVLGKLDGIMQKNETGPLFYTTHKNKFKMSERPKVKETGNHQNPRTWAAMSLTLAIATSY